MKVDAAMRRRKPGRKPDAERAGTVLGAAIAEFLDKGYDGANLRSIIAASGASAGSVYRDFGSKQGLFREIIGNHVDLSYPRAVSLAPRGRPIEEELAEFASAYLREFLDPRALALFAMVVAEAENFPDETRRLWELGPRNAAREVEAYLRHHQEAGAIQVEDLQLAAAQFLDMIKCGFHVRQMLAGIAPAPDELERNVRQAVAIFCRGIHGRTS